MRASPDDRVVVLVGASSGIGRATAHRLARRGDALVLASRSRAVLETVARECADVAPQGWPGALVVPTDVVDRDAVAALLRSLDPTAGSLETSHEGSGQRFRAALRHREADVLPEHGQQPAEDAAPGRVRGHVRVHRVASQEQPAALAAEVLVGEPSYGKDADAGQVESPRDAGPVKGAVQARRAAAGA